MASCRMLAASPAPSDRPCVFTLAPYKPKSQTSSEFYYFGSGGGAGSWNSNSNVDSGLSSDQEGQTPPPLPRRRAGRSGSRNEDCDWSDLQSDVSADSLANDDAATESTSLSSTGSAALESPKSKAIPAGLLDEIRLKGSAKKRSAALDAVQHNLVNMRLSTPRARSTQRQAKAPAESCAFPTLRSRRDSYPASGSARSLDDLLGFHLRECGEQHKSTDDDLSFVGHKDLLSDDQKNVTIRSHKGTVRGVRNRVRAGINTFLQGKPFKVSFQVRCSQLSSIFFYFSFRSASSIGCDVLPGRAHCHQQVQGAIVLFHSMDCHAWPVDILLFTRKRGSSRRKFHSFPSKMQQMLTMSVTFF